MASEGSATGRTRRFRVFRYRRGDDAPHTDSFDVPVDASSTVLEGLRWIKVHADPSLAIRHSCFHASCGTCGVRVDGREGLACVSALDPAATSVTVEPMANFPVLADLVVEMEPFVERFAGPHPIVRPVEPASGEPGLGGVEPERFEDCIECGLCLSACPVAATDDTYVGPAALAYAQRMLERGEGERDAILDWADGPAGAWRCHAAFECTEACPSGVRPAQRIMALRRELVRPRGRG
jgi:succinate dehydrogenase / fumarate reductase iron-sulfur subunit